MHHTVNKFHKGLTADPLVPLFQAAIAACREADERGDEEGRENFYDVIKAIGSEAAWHNPIDARGVIMRLGYAMSALDVLCTAASCGVDVTQMVDEIEGHILRSAIAVARASNVDIQGEGLDIHYPPIE